jgi:D-alanyl-D-alanine carboxypeptidase
MRIDKEFLSLYNMGHSENAPWLNLKKLMFPTSTTAMMTVFLPALSAVKGCGPRARWETKLLSDGKTHEKSRWYHVWSAKVPIEVSAEDFGTDFVSA